MRDNRYTNMWGEDEEEQKKRREWLRQVYDDAIIPDTDIQTPLNQDNKLEQDQTQYTVNNTSPQIEQNTTKEPSLWDKTKYATNSLIQGGSLGWSDEIAGIGGGIGAGLASLSPENTRGESFVDAFKYGYQQARDENRKYLQEGYDRAPVVSKTAEVIGNIASPLNKLGGISSKAPLSRQLADGTKLAVRNGAIEGFGSGQGGVGNHAWNTAVGALANWGGNKIGQKLRSEINSVFMNKKPRQLASDTIETLSSEAIKSPIDEWEELRRRFGF